MKFILASLTAAAAAFVASAAPIETPEGVMTDLPARFGLSVVTEDPKMNGLRIQYVNSALHIPYGAVDPNWPPVDAFFTGGKGYITLDRTVHKIPNSNIPMNPGPSGDWNLIIFPEVNTLDFTPEEYYLAWKPTFVITLGRWVQDSDGLLHLLDADGALVRNGLRLCGTERQTYQFWWDPFPYIDCPVTQFKIIPL